MNLKKLRRLYREEKLAVRKRGGRKRALGTRRPLALPARPNERWSLDFVSDTLNDGRRFRVMTVVDDFKPARRLLHRRRTTTHIDRVPRSATGRRASSS